MKPTDDELELADRDAHFVRALGSAYQPPQPGAAERARFAAGLEARLARGPARRPWWVGGAVAAAAAALVLALRPGDEPAPQLVRAAAPALVDEGPSTEEALLLLTNGPLADPDEALPDDYRTIASLLE
jgi:hypothetical protein